MSLELALKLIHVFGAFWLVGGLFARWVTLSRAEHADDIRTVSDLSELAGRFDFTVRPASFVVLVGGLLTAWAQGQPLFGDGAGWVTLSLILFFSVAPLIVFVFVPAGRRFDAVLAAARERGSVTPELRSAFRNSAVRAAHVYEVLSLGLIVYLMIAKPF